jgi:hypothetical protein
MMKIDANHIARSHGVDALRQAIDTAATTAALQADGTVLGENSILTPADGVIAALINDETLIPLAVAGGLTEEHFERGTGLRGAFRFAMMGSNAVREAL